MNFSDNSLNLIKFSNSDNCLSEGGGVHEQPLVTFALFAYNQEKYIREAVEGALAQSYDPMEVILSDDGSSDRTLEVMEEMVKSYRGPKSVRVRRTCRNMGTFLHVIDVARIAKGKLLILAAGDDISKKERTCSIVEGWQSSHAWGLYSRFDRISETGSTISSAENPRYLFPANYRLRHYLQFGEKVEIVHGATSAYDIRLFEFLDDVESEYILSEDGVLSILLNMLGKPIHMLDSSLVSYRENKNSLTNYKRDRGVALDALRVDEFKIEQFARSQANRCDLFLRWSKKFNNPYQKLICDEIITDFKKQQVRADWQQISFGEKLAFLKNNFGPAEIKWALPRLLPMPLFLRLKALMRMF